ncbi:hypothetical protein F503_01850 [Ophiostoma piceae UAMH 11346]|uniref:Uncharacterized protein n=1 Tax=Ophiostoma piceae (strain UAMH 11346) TaxID=1262450 RepID=S3BT21_OPHP1|nr:hypothetical protein F503_01850 [Ophiostoma piceae UAMH 11346]
MNFWFAASGHDVKIVLLAKAFPDDLAQKRILVEHWQERQAPIDMARPGATRTRLSATRSARTALQPLCLQTITIVWALDGTPYSEASVEQQRNPLSFNVVRGPLQLDFECLFLRPPQTPAEHDVVLPDDALRLYAASVWRANTRARHNTPNHKPQGTTTPTTTTPSPSITIYTTMRPFTFAALALAVAGPTAASNCKPSSVPLPCGTSLIGRDAEFSTHGDKWNIEVDPLSTYLIGTCAPYAYDACISYNFHGTDQVDATGSISFSYTMPTPLTSTRYRFWFYYRRTQDNGVDGTIGCNVDGAQSQYDDGLIYQSPNLWSLYAANFYPTGTSTTIQCSLTLSEPVTYDLTNFGYMYYCDTGGSQQR